ncbi:putative bifunctional diguanylate cyclase/phosphodiesterase [Saccharopolyspora cebuensis]|uniref:Bifunctional diguanylate cyclase/phosphodiesterase n=1 Tax=Saccharopolyspora cebuensis TaxID=418759 RepID=A0ABV4CN88_9PSEU
MTAHPPEVLRPQRYDELWRAEVAERWADELSTASYLPLARETIDRCLRDLVEDVVAALDEPSRIQEAGRAVGRRLVEMHARGQDSLAVSLRLIREALLGEGAADAVHDVLGLLTAIAVEYARADRASTFEQQENLKRALLRSKLRADRELAASEAQLSEVFLTTPIGVAICALDGRFVEVNSAFEETLGYRGEELDGRTIHDLFHPDDAEFLAAAYAELVEGGEARRLTDRKRLLRANGEEASAYLAVSVLRGPDGAPAKLVTMVEDITELHALQERFHYQALHDALTGLPNRQYFRTRLEAALAGFPPDAALALYHLALEGFELINDGLGHEVGDQVIRLVARRLSELVEGEEALVARFGGTEFAILVRQGSATPTVPEFAALINEVLAEPFSTETYGIAASASIGVVQRAVRDGDATNMLWAADVALRRAEAAGTRQWALFDPDRAPEERTEARLAAVMPGGLETGEFDVVYRPLVALATGGVVALETELLWDTAGDGAIGHAECLRLAERSGVTLSLRDWMLVTAWEQLDDWHSTGHPVRLALALSENQTRDPDLVVVIRRALAQRALDPRWLRLLVPMSALLGERCEEARDNVHHLNRMGVRSSVHGFRGSPEELHHLRALPVDVVRLDDHLVRLVHEAESPDAPEIRALHAIVPLIEAVGARLCVDGIRTEEQAARWRELGCAVGAGELFSRPVHAFDVPDLLGRMPVEPD